MLKWMGALCLLFAGAAAGYLQSRKLRERVERLRAFCAFLNAAATQISYAALPVEEICARHGRQLDFLEPYFSALERGEHFPQAWQNAVNCKLLCEEDRVIVREFGEGFGASDVDGQLSHCNLCKELAQRALNRAEEEKQTKGKLYQMLGIFGGAAAALLLC